MNGDLRDVSRLLAEAERADSESGASLEAAVATSYLLLTGQGDIDTAHRLLVGAIERRVKRSDAVDVVLAAALQTLLYVCWVGGRSELWKPLEAALSRLGPNVPEVLALSSGFYADPVRASASALAGLDAAVGALRDVTDPADIARIVDSAIFLDRLGGCRPDPVAGHAGARAGDGNTSVHTA